MKIGLYHAANGMISNWEAQNTIGGNLSRTAIPGARAEVQAFTSVLNNQNKLQDPTDGSLPLGQKFYDFSQGAIQSSDSAFHFAIEGNAFFRIQEKDGSESYTRNGQFVKAPDTSLRTADGATLLDSNGAPVYIPETGEFVLSREGFIKIDGFDYGQIGTASFQDPNRQLSLYQYGRFQAKPNETPEFGLAVGDTLSQYKLETSNIQPVEEMINMIQINRAYEANQRMVRATDNTTGELLNIINS